MRRSAARNIREIQNLTITGARITAYYGGYTSLPNKFSRRVIEKYGLIPAEYKSWFSVVTPDRARRVVNINLQDNVRCGSAFPAIRPQPKYIRTAAVTRSTSR